MIMCNVSYDFEQIVKRYRELHAERTSTCNIWQENIGAFLSPPLARGNSKVKDTLIFDLPAVESCPVCHSCKENCYALAQQRMYEGTFLKRGINFFYAIYRKDLLAEMINHQLGEERKRKKRYAQVRIHSSGDFFSQAYIEMWKDIAKKNRDFLFFFYTKADRIFDFKSFAALKNVRKISSILPDGDKNFGKDAFIQSKLAKFGNKIALCPCHNPRAQYVEQITGQKFECMRNCKLCLHNKYILIYEHK